MGKGARLVPSPVDWAELCAMAKEEATRLAGCRVATYPSVPPGTILVAEEEPVTQSSATYAVRVSFATGMLPLMSKVPV